MSVPTDDPADFAACANHEQVYPIGGSCPECDTDEARELADRWVFHRAPPTIRGVNVGALLDPGGALSDADRERLFAWVRERVATEGDDLLGQLDPHGYVTEIIGSELDLDDESLSHAEYLDRAWALLDAAKAWPS